MQFPAPLEEISAYSTFAATITLILSRPRIGLRFRVTPVFAALLGVSFFVALGFLESADFVNAIDILWSPLLTIAAIMVLSTVAGKLGVFHWLSSFAESKVRSVSQLYRRVFILAAISSAVLNNDATMLMLTPLVITLIRRRYPEQPQLLIPFAFAVFMACGGAPFFVSNPMNMVIASIAHLDFNVYARTMIPVTLVACTVSYWMLRLIYRKTLAVEVKPVCAKVLRFSDNRGCGSAFVLLLSIFMLYPVVVLLHGPVWLVATSGALLALFMVYYYQQEMPMSVLKYGVSWQTLGFLVAVFLLGAGLRNAGIVSHISDLYKNAGVFTVGLSSALGSALMDNHPMAIVNIMALGGSAADLKKLFAALVGGDLGPRLLPMGSLAGLIWISQLERSNIHIPTLRFFKIGSLVMFPTLFACLALLLAIY